MNVTTDVGKNIQSLRKQKKLTQEKLGERAGIDAKYISALELGYRNPTVTTLEKIAKGLGVEVYELFIFFTPYPEQEKAKIVKSITSIIKGTDAKTLNTCLELLTKLLIGTGHMQRLRQ